ncbi:MAG: chorismate mutase [Bryobacterales bacterium]|nr:chorismate mutase [Bryobacterales bacterium]
MTRKQALEALARYRESIDEVDRRILALLNERTRIVEEIGRVKRDQKMPIYEPKREDQVFGNVTGSNRGPLPADAVKRIFERVIDEMRSVQRERMVQEQSGGAEAK